MIGSGLKKLAKQHGMTVSAGVAYGSLMGFATTLSEGSGYKRIDISTKFTEVGQQEQFQAEVNAVDVTKLYRVQNLGISPKCITVIFTDNPGTMKKVEEFVEWFYPLLARCGAVGANVCLECGSDVAAGGWYLINGVAYHMHDSCAQSLQAEFDAQEQQRQDEDTGSYGMGILGAFLGATLGAAVWAIVLWLGYVASVVGLLIGWLAEKGYTLLRGKQGKGKLVILILAVIFGVVLGTMVPDVVALGQMIASGELPGFAYTEIPGLIIVLLAEDSEYAGATVSNIVLGLVFAALGVFGLLRKANSEVSGQKMKKLS